MYYINGIKVSKSKFYRYIKENDNFSTKNEISNFNDNINDNEISKDKDEQVYTITDDENETNEKFYVDDEFDYNYFENQIEDQSEYWNNFFDMVNNDNHDIPVDLYETYDGKENSPSML